MSKKTKECYVFEADTEQAEILRESGSKVQFYILMIANAFTLFYSALYYFLFKNGRWIWQENFSSIILIVLIINAVGVAASFLLNSNELYKLSSVLALISAVVGAFTPGVFCFGGERYEDYRGYAILVLVGVCVLVGLAIGLNTYLTAKANDMVDNLNNCSLMLEEDKVSGYYIKDKSESNGTIYFEMSYEDIRRVRVDDESIMNFFIDSAYGTYQFSLEKPKTAKNLIDRFKNGD